MLIFDYNILSPIYGPPSYYRSVTYFSVIPGPPQNEIQKSRTLPLVVDSLQQTIYTKENDRVQIYFRTLGSRFYNP